MKKTFLNNTYLFCIVVFFSCNSKSLSTVQNKSLPIENVVDTIFNRNDSLYGFWFVPHSATINITFNKDRTFIFNDYDIDNDKEEILYGTYYLHDKKLTLKSTNGKQFTFKFEKGKGIDENFYIKNKDYYFVKSD
jgi:hypothetical protein